MRRELAILSQGLLRPTRGRELRAALARERGGIAQLEHYRATALAELLNHAGQKVPFYRGRVPGAGAIRAEEAFLVLAALPTVSKAMLIEAAADFRVSGQTRRRISSRTGGSTGTILTFDLDREANSVRFAADMRSRQWAGWRSGEVVAMLWGHHADLKVIAALGARLRNALLHRLLMLDATNLGEARALAYLDAMRGAKATLLIGYSSALYFLAQTMLTRGVPNPGVRGVICTAESLGSAERAIMAEAFGCPILNRYGSREMGVVAQQCEQQRGLHVNADCVHLEVLRADGVPCAVGELGEIVLTDLHNHIMPFLRYRTGDLGVLAGEPCPCGRHLPTLSTVEGRLSDLLVGRGGQVFSCPGPVFWTEGVVGVRQLQLYQPNLETIEARVVPAAEWNQTSASCLAERLRSQLGDVRVEIVVLDEIPVPTSGKYRFAISEVSPFTTRSSRT